MHANFQAPMTHGVEPTHFAMSPQFAPVLKVPPAAAALSDAQSMLRSPPLSRASSYSTADHSRNQRGSGGDEHPDAALRNIYVRNLSSKVTAEEMRQIFAQYGEVESHKLMVDIKTGQSRGFGFVMYVRATDAAAAVKALDGFDLHGQHLQVRLADAKTRPPGEPTRRLFLRNLPPTATQAEVTELCGGAGCVVSCVVRRDERHAQKCRNGGLSLVAHVEMESVHVAQSVVASLNNSTAFLDEVPEPLLAKIVDNKFEAPYSTVTPPSHQHSRHHDFHMTPHRFDSGPRVVVTSIPVRSAAQPPPPAPPSHLSALVPHAPALPPHGLDPQVVGGLNLLRQYGIQYYPGGGAAPHTGVITVPPPAQVHPGSAFSMRPNPESPMYVLLPSTSPAFDPQGLQGQLVALPTTTQHPALDFGGYAYSNHQGYCL